MDAQKKQVMLDILKEELIPALGCTEPIAIAYASAVAVQYLGAFPEHVSVEVSGNIIKNVKSVVVPNTGGLKGIDVAAVIGAVGGKAELKLEVLREVSDADIERCKSLIESGFCNVKHLKTPASLHVIVTAERGAEYCRAELKNGHVNLVSVVKNGETLFQKSEQDEADSAVTVTLKDIFAFVEEIDLSLLSPLLDKQIECNMAICREGLKNNYGQSIGKTLIEAYGDDVRTRARAMASAGSDARMNGCGMPVVINSGSGNQGITVSVPIIVFAEEYDFPKEKLYRALILSNLTSIYIKRGMGKLSAYCGVVSAACGAGAGLTFLFDGDREMVAYTITNVVANVSGIFCDGAKASCAAKIASSVDAAILAHTMAMKRHAFSAGDGIVKKDIESTLDSVIRLGKDGMKETDLAILKIMLE